MKIHKTHSKKELVEIIQQFKIDVDNPTTLRKKQLVSRLEKELDLMNEIEPELDRYVFYNFIDMTLFLQECNPKKVLTIKEKNDVILDCRKIQQYIKNDFFIEGSVFDDVNQVYDLADKIKVYGDIPSVRRMCRDMNTDPKSPREFIPLMSKQTRRELEIRQQLKEKYSKALEVSYGTFSLSFS